MNPVIQPPIMFFYIYVLESLKNGERYIGFTSNLKRRLEEHKKGQCFTTKFMLPFKLIYLEGCTHSEDAKRREKYLKTHQGRKFLGLRLIKYKHSRQAFGMGG